MTDVIVIFLCGLFFALLPPKQPEKLQFYKNEKINRRYHYFTHLYQKFWSDNVRFLRYGVWQTDRQTDGWMDRRMDRKSDILRRVPQLKINPTIDIFRSFGRPVYWLGRPNSGAQKTLFKFAFFRMDLLISKWLRIKKWKQKRKTMRQRGQSDRKNCQYKCFHSFN